MKRLLLIPVLIVLAACGNPQQPLPAEGLTKHVSLLVGEQGFAFAYKVFAIAGFSPFQTPFTGTLPENPLADRAENCVVTSGDDTDPLAQFDFLAAPLQDAVSVGASVTVEADGVPYATLPERDFFGAPIYGSGPTEDGIAEPPLPQSLSLTVPEGDYASANGATLTPVTRLEWTAPGRDEAVTPETAFTWTAANGDALIVFQVTQGNDPGVEDDLSVFCLASDDGEFNFPAETQGALSEMDAGTLMQTGRLGLRYEARGDTALLLASVSYLVYNLSAE